MRERTKPQGARLERILRNFPRLSENSQGSGGPETCQSPLSPRGQEMTGEKAINIKRMRADAKTNVCSIYLEFKTKATKHVLHANICELPVLAELPQGFFFPPANLASASLAPAWILRLREVALQVSPVSHRQENIGKPWEKPYC